MEPVLKLLRVAKIVSIEIPVPGLSTALELALNIAEKAKEIKDTRDACRLLAERAAHFSLGIYDQLKHCNGDDRSVAARERIELLILALRDIENLMKRRGKMRLRTILGRNGKIDKEVQKLGTQLEDAIKSFELQTAINIEQTVVSTEVRLIKHVEDTAHIGETLIGVTRGLDIRVLDMAKRLDSSGTYDGALRLFGHENLDLVESIYDAAARTQPQTSRAPTGRAVVRQQLRPVCRDRAVVKSAGELSGTRVVVYTYPRQDDLRFAETIKFARQAQHPYLLKVLGYSRLGGDPDAAPFVVTEDYTPLTDFVNSLDGLRKLRLAMQVTADVSEAVDHLNRHGLSRLLHGAGYFWTVNGVNEYMIKQSELVWDHQHGGRFKWAGATESRNSERDDDPWAMSIPADQEGRIAQRNLYATDADANVGVLARNWLNQFLSPFANGRDLLSSALGWNLWGLPLRLGRPEYPLGMWVAFNAAVPWPCPALAAQDAGLQKTEAFSPRPYALPWQGSGEPHPSAESETMTEDEGEHTLEEKLYAGWALDVPACDLCEMCIDVTVGPSGTRWKRYQVSCVPIGTTLLFRHFRRFPLRDSSDNISRLIHSAPDLSTASPNEIGIATELRYYTETTAYIAPHAAHEVPPPLWFFLYAQADHDNSPAQDPSIPFGFWSLEKNPRSVPEGVIFDPTPRFEHIKNGYKAPLSTWTQTLGDLTFITQTKMFTRVQLMNDEDLLALEILQEEHRAACADCIDRAHFGEESSDNGCAAITRWADEEGEEQSDEEYYDADEYDSEQEGNPEEVELNSSKFTVPSHARL